MDALTSLQGHRVVRGDDVLLMARFVWAVVHGVAMLAIDGQLPEADAIEKLMRYAIKRLQTGIEGIPRLGRRPTSVYAEAGRCARRNERIWRTARGIRSLGSFHGNMLTSAFGASIAHSMATA